MVLQQRCWRLRPLEHRVHLPGGCTAILAHACTARAQQLRTCRASQHSTPTCSAVLRAADTVNRRLTRQLTLDSAKKGDARVLSGPDNDGWYVAFLLVNRQRSVARSCLASRAMYLLP